MSRFELGNRAGAISDFTEAIGLRPNDPVVYRARANAYAVTKVQDITQALRLNADDPDSLATRLYIYSELGQRDKAIEDLRYVVRLRPNMTEAADALKRLTADPRAGGINAPARPTCARSASHRNDLLRATRSIPRLPRSGRNATPRPR